MCGKKPRPLSQSVLFLQRQAWYASDSPCPSGDKIRGNKTAYRRAVYVGLGIGPERTEAQRQHL